jgi:hypothetical protein
MSRGQYLCGCSRDEKRGYILTTQPDGSQGYTRRDKEGYEVCPEHSERLYGWQSHIIMGPQGNDILDPMKYAKSGDLKDLKTDFEDRRDNRDPQTIGKKILAKTNGRK